MTWDTPVTSLLPVLQARRRRDDEEGAGPAADLRLHRPAAAGPRVALRVRRSVTPENALATLGTMQPTSKFGELFQYSNPHGRRRRVHRRARRSIPDMELGAAYDRAMQTQVFDPLGMKSHDLRLRARRSAGDHAAAACAGRRRQAGARGDGAELLDHPAAARGRGVEQHARTCCGTCRWSSPTGSCPTASPTSRRSRSSTRRAPQVAIGKDETYGMGLMVDTEYGIPVVHHGGDMVGYHSDMIWLPGQNVGAVILTNGDPGWLLRCQLPPQAARGPVRRQARGGDPGGRGRQDLLRADRRGAEALDRAGGGIREREARARDTRTRPWARSR